MNNLQVDRKWMLDIGEGRRMIVILPRMDYRPLDKKEWESILQPFLKDSRFLIIDIPEKMSQEQNGNLDFTVYDLANECYTFLISHNLRPDMIWGFSLGGMIAQELSVFKNIENIPLLLISTNLFADIKLRAIFSSWLLMTEKYGIKGFDISLVPWISDARNLPIISYTSNDYSERNDKIALNKIKASLKAVAFHDARKISYKIKAPIEIFFGENSVLLGDDEAKIFNQYLPKSKITFVKESGMRIMNDNLEYMIPLLKGYINEI